MTIKDEKTAEFIKLAKELRRERRIKQFTVCSELGISLSQLSMMENSKSELRITEFLKLSKAIGIHTTCYLVDDETRTPVLSQMHFDNCDIAKLLRTLRENLGITVNFLRTVGFSSGTIWRLEKGANASISILFRYIRALGLSIEFKGV